MSIPLINNAIVNSSSSIAIEPIPPIAPPAHHYHHHHHHDEHTHTHGAIAPEITTSDRGLWAVKWSFLGLAITAIAQIIVFAMSGSVALMADMIHNIGDAMTSIPLAVAFLLSRCQPNQRFAYGYGRAEDLAGVAIVAIIFFSALITGYESINRVFHPQPLTHLSAIAAAAIVGLIGNELVALFRIRIGKEINSAALVADGLHARADGLVSLAVLVSAIGVGLGYTWADPVVGLCITAVLLRIVWESGQTIFSRLLDGVEPELIETIRHAIEHVSEVNAVDSIRARWLGHRLYVEVAIAISPKASIQTGQTIANTVQHALHDHIPYIGSAVVQVLPDFTS
jgi:cation diffusion facilitator family transporter